jgi:hypothetical protein
MSFDEAMASILTALTMTIWVVTIWGKKGGKRK